MARLWLWEANRSRLESEWGSRLPEEGPRERYFAEALR